MFPACGLQMADVGIVSDLFSFLVRYDWSSATGFLEFEKPAEAEKE